MFICTCVQLSVLMTRLPSLIGHLGDKLQVNKEVQENRQWGAAIALLVALEKMSAVIRVLASCQKWEFPLINLCCVLQRSNALLPVWQHVLIRDRDEVKMPLPHCHHENPLTLPTFLNYEPFSRTMFFHAKQLKWITSKVTVKKSLLLPWWKVYRKKNHSLRTWTRAD